uniref:Uncharacterized protein n=1 Tax=Meloidogyne enterolobii TaxID=390850 RepID=A0A6V7URM3_MELEN|nr:unnamed protein product [Meloidogyne enterolobii]
MFYSLPMETKIDIFKCLNYEQLSLIKQTNLYFRDFINNFEGKLAREELFKFTIAFSNNFEKIPHKYVRPEAGNFDFALFDEQHKELNKQIDEMWSNGQQKRIPLYLPDHGLLDNIVISLSIVYNNIEEVNIILDLPTVITNKKQMKIVYHYLNRLFNCSFVFADFDQFIFNPELIKLFFENAEIPGKFYVINWIPKYNWRLKPTDTDSLLKFILDHLVSETFKHVNNPEVYAIILFEIIMRGDKFRGFELIWDKLSELVNFYSCLYVSFF